YSLEEDIITIKYPDYTYKAKLSFQGDTLVMNSVEYGETKFWRFENLKPGGRLQNASSGWRIFVQGTKGKNQKCNKMDSLNNFFQELYKNFNDRKIDLVISKMTENVKWANGMEGGYVYGHNGVRDYWTRQFTMVSSNVTP